MAAVARWVLDLPVERDVKGHGLRDASDREFAPNPAGVTSVWLARRTAKQSLGYADYDFALRPTDRGADAGKRAMGVTSTARGAREGFATCLRFES